MSMVGGLDLHRRQITYDVLDVESGEIWRGRLWQSDRALQRKNADPLSELARTRGDASSTRRLGRPRRRGLHRLALRHRRDLESRLRALPRRAGRHASSTGKKAPRQDRPLRRALAESSGSPTNCRRAGSHPRRCSSGANASASTSPSSTNARSAASASTPRSTTTASPFQKAPSAPRKPARRCKETTFVSQRRVASGSRRATR